MIKWVGICGVIFVTLLLASWLFREETSIVAIHVSSKGVIRAVDQKTVYLPGVAVVLEAIGYSYGGTILTNESPVSLDVNKTIANEIAAYITDNKRYGFHGGWGVSMDVDSDPYITITVQMGLDEKGRLSEYGSIARHWKMTHGQWSRTDSFIENSGYTLMQPNQASEVPQ